MEIAWIESVMQYVRNARVKRWDASAVDAFCVPDNEEQHAHAQYSDDPEFRTGCGFSNGSFLCSGKEWRRAIRTIIERRAAVHRICNGVLVFRNILTDRS